jgi:D-alanyl-D-alanine carboxypeptidase (penicillin-binding protein 5/6)
MSPCPAISPLLRHRSALTALVACTLGSFFLASCGDPKREERLKWREEEVDAKEAAVLRRDAEIQQERKQIESLKLDLTAKQKAAEKLQTELAAELDKYQRVRRELELRELRGPLPHITAERVIIIDPATGDVIFEKDADKEGAIASTTKLLTALLVVETGDLDKEVVIQKSDTQCAPVRLGLKEGEVYTRRQLLTAVLVKSSNDIAQALARDNAGTMEAFVEKMNARCAELGLKHSAFANPHGLPADEGVPQFSTARDLSVIAALCDTKPEIREIVSLKSYRFVKPDKKEIQLENTNRVLRNYSYCDGMKTGYTNAAGYCLVCSGEKNGKRRIVVVLNDTDSGVWKDSQALLEWALRA